VKLTLEIQMELKVKVKRGFKHQGFLIELVLLVMARSSDAVTNTILGRMQSASTCPTCGSGQIWTKPAEADSQG
jgi:molecular chaperone DnaJ